LASAIVVLSTMTNKTAVQILPRLARWQYFASVIIVLMQSGGEALGRKKERRGSLPAAQQFHRS
jgi:hypothetical protein